MTIKERVLEAARTSYAKNGLKAKELEKLSDVISTGLTDEASDDDVQNAVKNAEPYVNLMQSVGNRYATETTTKFNGYVSPEDLEAKYQLKDTGKKKPEEEGGGGTGTALSREEIEKLISESNKKAVEDALAPFKAEQEAKRLATLLESNVKLKSIPKEFRSRYTLDKEENLDSVISTIENDYAAMKKAMIKSGEFVENPQNGGLDADTDDLIERMNKMAERAEKK